MSFFKTLKQIQADRSVAEMSEWGGGERQILAEKISQILHKQLGWRSAIFVPQDVATVAFYGPSFGIIDADIAFDDMVDMLRKDYSLIPTISFWESMENSTLGQMIDGLLSSR